MWSEYQNIVNLTDCSIQLDREGAKCELAREVLRSRGKLRLGVTGWSMLPTIWPGDTLVIESLDPEDIATGDVVLFARDHRLFVHRAVKDNNRKHGFITRGDAMPHPDTAVDSSELLGRIVFLVRDGIRFEVPGNSGFASRMLAAIFQRSYWATRIFVELLHIHQRRTSACRN